MAINRRPASGEDDALVDAILKGGGSSSGSSDMDSEVDAILGASGSPAESEVYGPPSPNGIMDSLTPAPPPIAKEAPSKLWSAAKGIAHGVTLGGIDEAEGALGTITGEGYGPRRDKFRASHEEARLNPKSYMVGEIIGGVAASKVIPGSPFVKALGEGAAYGFGSSEGGLGARVEGAQRGAAAGLGGYALGKGIQKVAPSVKDYLSKKLLGRAEKKMDLAVEEATMQAGGKTKGVRDRLTNTTKYPRTANPKSPAFENRAEEIGNELIVDQSVVAPGVAKAIGKKRMMGPVTSAENIATRAEAAREYLGEKIGKYAESLDSQFENLKRTSEAGAPDVASHIKQSRAKMALDLYPNPQGIVNRLKKLQNQWAGESSAHAQWSPKLEKHIVWFEEQAQKYAGKPVPFATAEKWKRRLYAVIDENRKDPLQMTENKVIQNVARAVKHEIHDSIERIAQTTQQGDILTPFIEIKRKYGLMDDIYELSTDWVERRDKGNLKFGLRELLFGVMGTGLGDGALEKMGWALGLMGLSRGAKKYGHAINSSAAQVGAAGALKANEIQKYLLNKAGQAAPAVGSATGRTEEAQDYFRQWFGSEKFRKENANTQ